MSRGPSSPPPADAPHYHYDPNLGSPRDSYRRVDFRHTSGHQPEQPARFVAVVDGETMMMSMWGRRAVAWLDNDTLLLAAPEDMPEGAPSRGVPNRERRA